MRWKIRFAEVHYWHCRYLRIFVRVSLYVYLIVPNLGLRLENLVSIYVQCQLPAVSVILRGSYRY